MKFLFLAKCEKPDGPPKILCGPGLGRGTPVEK